MRTPRRREHDRPGPAHFLPDASCRRPRDIPRFPVNDNPGFPVGLHRSVIPMTPPCGGRMHTEPPGPRPATKASAATSPHFHGRGGGAARILRRPAGEMCGGVTRSREILRQATRFAKEFPVDYKLDLSGSSLFVTGMACQPTVRCKCDQGSKTRASNALEDAHAIQNDRPAVSQPAGRSIVGEYYVAAGAVGGVAGGGVAGEAARLRDGVKAPMTAVRPSTTRAMPNSQINVLTLDTG